MINTGMITRNGIQQAFFYKKRNSSPWQAITDIARENNMSIIDVFLNLEINMRLEILKEVEHLAHQSSIK